MVGYRSSKSTIRVRVLAIRQFKINKIMLDYERKYLDLTSGLNKCIPDISQEFPNANGFEKSVIAMRQKG